MDRYRAKGVITVFFSLISVLFLSLICTTIESARVAGARAQTANISDMGNYSVFGEYEKKLLEKYEVFAVDGSYGTGDFSIGRMNDRLQQFLTQNGEPKQEKAAGLCFDPWNLQLCGSKIREYALLSDKGGEAFYQQAVAYMKKTLVTGSIGKLFQYYNDARNAKQKQEDYQKNKTASDKEMQNLEKEEEQKKQELEVLENQNQSGEIVTVAPAEPMEKTNPLEELNKLRKKAILEIVCGQTDISDKTVEKKELPSKRSGQKGNMKLENQYGGISCDLLFREYLLDHFPNYRSVGKEESLDYQLEYIIAGKRCDRDNLKAVVQKLLLLREGLNYLYCAQDVEMSAQAGGLAALLIGWTGIPALVTVMKHALLLGWAYGESLMDVRTLMDGGKIPLFKTPDTWAVTLDELGRLGDLLEGGGKDRQEGFSYAGYLRILLNLQSVSVQKKRALDLVELNMKAVDGLSNFRVDYCVVGIKQEAEWEILPVFSGVPAIFLGTGSAGQRVTVKSGFAYD